jgi:hypothetical protein
MVDVEMLKAISRVGRRALAQDDTTPEAERLSVRAVLEQALNELDRIAEANEPTVKRGEPCRPTEPLTTPAKLGSHFAAAARKNGCEDEYDNAMEAKFGPGW